MPKCRKTGALLEGKKKRKTDSSKRCVQHLGCGCKSLQELLPVLSFLIPVPRTTAGHAVPGPRGQVMSTCFWGAGQNLATLRQKAPNASPSIQPQGSASPLSRARASELRVHFNACISHPIHMLVSHSGLFTSFQRQQYLKHSELAVEVLPVHRRKTAYISLQGGFSLENVAR